MCVHQFRYIEEDCPERLAYYYRRWPDGLYFLIRKCSRVFALIVETLILLPESPNQWPGSDHDCRKDLKFDCFGDQGEIIVHCPICGKVFKVDDMRLNHVQSLANCIFP